MKENHENWLLEQLAGMAQHFPEYTLPDMARAENDTTQAAALHDRRTATEMREVAGCIVTDKLEGSQAAAEALRNKISEMHDLIAEGKAALRAGEPVRPECGIAGQLLPDLNEELQAAEAVVSDIERERSGLLHDADQRDDKAARSLSELCNARRVMRIETLLRLAMDEAEQLANDEGTKGRFQIRIQPDQRLNKLAGHGWQIEILRANRGVFK